jgi:hypothetical protein
MTLSKIDLANMVENDLAAGSQPLTIIENKINFRNIIINGDMSIAQRGTSTASITGNTYALDRFLLSFSGSQGTWTVAQSSTVPSGQGFATSTKIDCTTADASPASGDRIFYAQRIEGQNLQYLKKGTSSAESTTLSFWVRSNKTGTYIANLFDNDNSRHISKSYTISSADTWEKKTITFAGDTSGTFGNDNARSLDLRLYLGAGTDYTSGTLATSWESATNANAAVGQVNLADSTSNEWYVTGVQLEVGTAASDFEFLPVDVNLFRCQRYYFKTQDGVGTSNAILMTGGIESSTSSGQGSLTLPTEMRSTPTLSFGSGVRFYSNGSSTVTPTIAGNRSTSSNLSAVVTISGGTNGQAGYCYQGDTSGNIIGDAEL